MSDTIQVSSILVTAEPSRVSEITKRIEKFDFARIATTEPSGKLIVILQSPTKVALVQGLTDLQMMPGVISATLQDTHTDTL